MRRRGDRSQNGSDRRAGAQEAGVLEDSCRRGTPPHPQPGAHRGFAPLDRRDRRFAADGSGLAVTAKSPSAAAVNEPQNDQENNGTDGGHYDGRNDAGAEVDAQLGQQPTADERADDSDADVRDEAIAAAIDELSGKPSRDQAAQQNDENRLIRHGHFLPSGDTAHRGRRPQSPQPYRTRGIAASRRGASST